MTRNYVAVDAALPHRPKFRRLSIPGRAALFTLWCDGVTRTPEAIWKSRAELADVLDLDGFGPEVLDEFLARGWIDELPDGRLAVHDWDEHQVAYSLDMTRAYERARKMDWRNRRTLSPHPSPVGEARQGEVRLVPESSGQVPDNPGHRARGGSKEPATRRNGVDPEQLASVLKEMTPRERAVYDALRHPPEATR